MVLHALATAVASGWAAAGAVVGTAQGMLTALNHRPGEANTFKSGECSDSLQELGAGLLQAPARVKNLVNIVIAGDQGLGKRAMAAFHGRPHTYSEPHTSCELELAEVVVDQRPITLAVWCLGGRGDTAGLGQDFFRLASSCILAYDAERSPLEPLAFWSGVCGGGSNSGCGGGSALQAAVVLACCPAGGSTQQQQQQERHLEAGRRWCSCSGGGTPHIVMRGSEDGEAVQRALTEAALLGLHQAHQQALQLGSSGMHCGKISGLQLHLPAAMQGRC